jgi:DNA-binding Lrp family transcriptional regulator
MDALDIRILRAMGIQPYGRTPRPLDHLRAPHIARALKVSPERVRGRIAKMESSGLIQGYDLYPNYRHLGLEATWYYYNLEDEDAAEGAGAKLAPVEGVGACCWFLGGMMCVNVLYRSPADLERKLKVMRALAGEGGLHKLYDVEMPHVHRPLTRTDWKVLQALRGHALRPLPEVAHAVGASTKTVRRHLDRMGKEGAFLPFPFLDISRAEGAILFYLTVRFGQDAPPDPVAAMARAFEGSMLATDRIASPEFGSLLVMLAARSTAEVNALRKRAAKVPGVARASPLMFAGAQEDEAWVDEAIAERLKAADRS